MAKNCGSHTRPLRVRWYVGAIVNRDQTDRQRNSRMSSRLAFEHQSEGEPPGLPPPPSSPYRLPDWPTLSVAVWPAGGGAADLFPFLRSTTFFTVEEKSMFRHLVAIAFGLALLGAAAVA